MQNPPGLRLVLVALLQTIESRIELDMIRRLATLCSAHAIEAGSSTTLLSLTRASGAAALGHSMHAPTEAPVSTGHARELSSSSHAAADPFQGKLQSKTERELIELLSRNPLEAAQSSQIEAAENGQEADDDDDMVEVRGWRG